MNFKFVISLAVIFSIIFSNSILAVKLESLEIISKNNEPFFAKIKVNSKIELIEDKIWAAIPSDEDLKKMNIQPSTFYNQFNFHFMLDENDSTKGIVIIRSEVAIFKNGKIILPVYIEHDGVANHDVRIYDYRDPEVQVAEKKIESVIKKLNTDDDTNSRIKFTRSEALSNLPSIGKMDIVNGDNLENISTAIKDAQFYNHRFISKEQIMYIIINNNSNSFISKNSLNLKINSQINIPEIEEIVQVDQEKAFNFINRFRQSRISQRSVQRRSNINNNSNTSTRNTRSQNNSNLNTFGDLSQQKLNFSENTLNLVSNDEEDLKQYLINELTKISESRKELKRNKNNIKNNLAELKNKITEISNLIDIQKKELRLLTGGRNESYNDISSDGLINNLLKIITEGDPLIIIIFTIFIILFISILISVFFNFNKKSDSRLK